MSGYFKVMVGTTMAIVFAKSAHRARKYIADHHIKIEKASANDLYEYGKRGGVLLDDTGALTPADAKAAENKAPLQEPTMGFGTPPPDQPVFDDPDKTEGKAEDPPFEVDEPKGTPKHDIV